MPGLKLASHNRRWLDGFKWPESSLPVMESIPNKWHCHQEGRSRSPQSIVICTGLLLGIKRTMTEADNGYSAFRDLSAVSGRRISRQQSTIVL
ncbi:hypothetical protein TNCV_4956001 [Trichonephila clavipes]|nr:hypothetical protein TNCV_4956001 [Trichonephila clavipes]